MSSPKYHCIQCLKDTQSLYRKYTSTSFKLTVCEYCGLDVDPYVEREDFLVAMDLVLLRQDAYRHFLINRTADFDVRKDWYKALQYLVVSSLNQCYLLWRSLRGTEFITPSTTSSPSDISAQAPARVQAFLSINSEQDLDSTAVSLFLLLSIQIAVMLLTFGTASFLVVRFFSRKNTAWRKLLTRIYLATMIPTFVAVISTVVLIWEDTATVRSLGYLLVLIYQLFSLYTVASVEQLRFSEFVFAMFVAFALSLGLSCSILKHLVLEEFFFFDASQYWSAAMASVA